MYSAEQWHTNKHTNKHIKKYIQSKYWGNLFLPSNFVHFLFSFPIILILIWLEWCGGYICLLCVLLVNFYLFSISDIQSEESTEIGKSTLAGSAATVSGILLPFFAGCFTFIVYISVGNFLTATQVSYLEYLVMLVWSYFIITPVKVYTV